MFFSITISPYLLITACAASSPDWSASLEKISGIQLVLNTSLNAPGKPIVETPNQAVKLFLSSDLDYLFLESFLIEKKSN